MPTRSGPPAHQNREAWIPNRADKQNTLKKVVEALPNQGVCQRCYEQIEWKKQYGKYKPLKQPAKCVGCGRRNVEHSYHTLCKSCARDRNACAKCAIQAPKPPERASDSEALERLPSADELAEMNERQRRSALRKVEKAKAARKQRERDAAEAAAAAAEGGASPASFTELGAAVGQPVAGSNDDDGCSDSDGGDDDVLGGDGHQEMGRAGAGSASSTQSAMMSTSAPPRAQGRAHLAQAGPADEEEDEDAAAVAAVEAEAVTESDDEDEDEEGGAAEDAHANDADGNEEEDEEDEDEDEEDDDDDGDETLQEQRELLAHSAGSAALVLQGYDWIGPHHFTVAEAGFDALCDRLADKGGGSAAAADAMTDRVAAIAQRPLPDGTTPGADGSLDGTEAATLAMLLEIESYATCLPASFNADSSEAERQARALLHQHRKARPC